MMDVIVIGGSAGALDVLIMCLPQLPDEVDTPIVIAIHQGAGQPSLIPQVLGRACARPVREIDDKEPLAGGAIHVAPPNYHVLLERNHAMSLSVDDHVLFSRPSIDVLFESATDAFGDRVVGVVLSGANEDGAAGLAQIADAGGVAIVQLPETAAYPMMPAAALRRSGARARAVPPGELAACLTRVAGVPRGKDRPREA